MGVCGFLVAQGLRLVKTNDRPAPGTALSAQIKSQIGRECKSLKPEDCAKYSMRLTADLLSFTEKNDLDNGKANCVGYAVLCSRICNYAFQVNGMGIERSLWWATCRSMASIYAACFRLLPLSDGRIL